jgi:DNA-binding GntR family transcriptional regulator
MPVPPERMPPNTKSTHIYEILKQDIYDGRLKPGHRLIISKVADAYGTSEIPVREAINRLQAEGLLTIIPHTGIYVTEIETEHLEKLYPVRGVLEAYATRLATPHLTSRDFDYLSRLIEGMDEVIEQEDYPEMGRLNREFHMTIYRASGNEPLIRMIDELWGKTTRVRGIFGLMPQIAARSNRQHKEILEALKTYRKRRAESLVFRQNQSTLKSLVDYFMKPRRTQTDGLRR